MKNKTVEEVKRHLRAKGFDVLGFYGRGDDPDKGWIKVWWWASRWPATNPRQGLNALIGRLPNDPTKAEEMKAAFAVAMAEIGWEQRAGGDWRVWKRKAVAP